MSWGNVVSRWVLGYVMLTGCGAEAGAPPVDSANAGADSPSNGVDPSRATPAPERARATPLPPGGTAVASVTGPLLQMTVTQSGGLWLLSDCTGLYAANGSEIRRYSWFDSPLPQRIFEVRVDAQDRVWIVGSDADSNTTLSVNDGGEWRMVVASGVFEFSVNADGTVWIRTSDERDQSFARQVSPELGELVPLPPRSSTLVAGPAGSFWLSTDEGIHRWSEGVWTGPAGPPSSALRYDPRRDVLFAEGATPVVVSWTGTDIETAPLARPAGTSWLDVREDGHLIALAQQQLIWLENGATVASVTLGPQAQPALGPDSSVYVISGTDVSRYHEGRKEAVLGVAAFDTEREFPWRTLAYGRVLELPSAEVERDDLIGDAREAYGVKVHVRGQLVSGNESAGLELNGAFLPYTWAQLAPEFAAFNESIGLVPFRQTEAGLPPPTEPAVTWDLYGYFETGTCFGHLGSATRQFWVVEGYPENLSATGRESLQADLRARHPSTEP